MSESPSSIESLNAAVLSVVEQLDDLEKQAHVVLAAAMTVSDHCTFPALADGLVFAAEAMIKATYKAQRAVRA
jgi:hypothetical protein